MSPIPKPDEKKPLRKAFKPEEKKVEIKNVEVINPALEDEEPVVV